MRKPTRQRLCVVASLLAAAIVHPAAAQDLTPIQTDLYWKRTWKNYARRCIQLNDRFYSLAAYEPQYPSSRGTTIALLRAKTSKEITERVGNNLTIRKHLVRPNEELKTAAEALPEMAAGHYGRLHSGEVIAILGPDEMVIADSWLIDADAVRRQQDEDEERLKLLNVPSRDISTIVEWVYEHREQLMEKQRDRQFRQPVKLIGFSTVGLAKGDRWRGPRGDGIDLAVAGSYVPESRRNNTRNREVLFAVPVSRFALGLEDEAQFIAYLKSHGYDQRKFVELYVKENLANPRDDRLRDARIFDTIEGRQEQEQEKERAER